MSGTHNSNDAALERTLGELARHTSATALRRTSGATLSRLVRSCLTTATSAHRFEAVRWKQSQSGLRSGAGLRGARR